MLRDLLTLATVTVNRETETSDGMGGYTTTTVSTILDAAMIYQSGSARQFLSDAQLAVSSHVLVTEPSQYTWTTDDKTVSYDSKTYDVVGTPDDVMGYGEVMAVPLRLQQ